MNDKTNGDPLIDISHESLIRQWDSLREWVDKEAESRAIYLRLANAASLYEEKEEGLYRNPALDVALEWRKKAKPNAVWAQRYHSEFDSAMSYLDKSKRRQRYRVASYLLLAAVVVAGAVTALGYKQKVQHFNEVEAKQQETDKARRVAQTKSEEAERERQLAVAARLDAEQLRGIAEAKGREADNERKLAVKQRQIAEEERRKAVSQTRIANEARRDLAARFNVTLAFEAYRKKALEDQLHAAAKFNEDLAAELDRTKAANEKAKKAEAEARTAEAEAKQALDDKTKAEAEKARAEAEAKARELEKAALEAKARELEAADAERLRQLRAESYQPPASRSYVVGTIRYQRSGKTGFLEILDDWANRNIVSVTIPELREIPNNGKPLDGNIMFYKGAAAQLQAAFREIKDHGLLNRILTWDSGYIPLNSLANRYATAPAGHSLGIAFDINKTFNPDGKKPVAIGQKGSVLELVPIFEKYGFKWWGNNKSWPVGEHFEVERLLRSIQ